MLAECKGIRNERGGLRRRRVKDNINKTHGSRIGVRIWRNKSCLTEYDFLQQYFLFLYDAVSICCFTFRSKLPSPPLKAII
ncbi:hypothetical protein NQ315_008500 [Exocentrus adspersus]|uniref:Uncharacterized protein n=1 Tax=Exocentrus adspersus TaxID=1586481 RepID=A0AAV8W5Y7_9CUCU|nr:hypothetical protein NQ315_008500 [Exocentrus adspersus]